METSLRITLPRKIFTFICRNKFLTVASHEQFTLISRSPKLGIERFPRFPTYGEACIVLQYMQEALPEPHLPVETMRTYVFVHKRYIVLCFLIEMADFSKLSST